MSGDYGEQAATGDGGMLAQRHETEMVLRELRFVEAVIPRLLASSFAQSRSRSRTRRILAARETVLDRQDPLRQINPTDSARNREDSCGTVRDRLAADRLKTPRVSSRNEWSIDFSTACSKCVKQSGRSIGATKRLRGQYT